VQVAYIGSENNSISTMFTTTTQVAEEKILLRIVNVTDKYPKNEVPYDKGLWWASTSEKAAKLYFKIVFPDQGYSRGSLFKIEIIVQQSMFKFFIKLKDS
jgi:hypothetical protein